MKKLLISITVVICFLITNYVIDYDIHPGYFVAFYVVLYFGIDVFARAFGLIITTNLWLCKNKEI